MPRARKVTVADAEPKPAKEKASKKGKVADAKKPTAKSNQPNIAKKMKMDYEHSFSPDAKSLAQIILSLQKSSTNEKKAIADLKKIYEKMVHAEFFDVVRKSLKAFLILPETQSDNSNKLLKFLASFVASFGDVALPNGETHPMITDTLDLILGMTSKFIHVRARICMLVAQLMSNFSPKAEIEEHIFENITARINGTFVRDPSPLVRQNALLALQRLQCPDDKDDPIMRVYQFHMESDPVAKVRMTVVTAIAKKLNIVPLIIDRLHDIDEKVRRHVYLQMASFPVKQYRIVDRISFLEAGLNDRSEKVTEVVSNMFLPNWISAYEYNYVEFIRAIKMDSNDKELTNFRNLAQKTLETLFKKQSITDLVNYLQLSVESEFPRCISFEKSSAIEYLLIWKVVIMSSQKSVVAHVEEDKTSDVSDCEDNEQHENIVPELSVLCKFIERFAKEFKAGIENDAKYQNLIFNHSLIVLFEIVELCDLSDVVGCGKIREIVKEVLIKNDLIESTIRKLAEVVQNIETDPEVSLNYFNDVIIEMVGVGASEYSRQATIEALINKADMFIRVKANGLKMNMMELKEKEDAFVDKKEYGKAQSVKEEYDQLEQQLHDLLRPLVEASSDNADPSSTLRALSSSNKKLTQLDTLKNLRIAFYALKGKGIKTINHRTLEIYNSFIRYYLECEDKLIRIWALKAAVSCSMLYESLSMEVLKILKTQIFKCTNTVVWETAINGITDLLLRYGLEKMLEAKDDTQVDISQNQSKKGGRTLYNNDEADEEDEEINGQINVMAVMNHILDTESDKALQRACYIGFCKLILHGQFSTRELVAKFLIAYFNPATDSEVNQILGIFFSALASRKKQDVLGDALIPTLKTLIDSPYDSPLREVKVETVVKFVINLTRPVFCSNGLNLHNVMFLKLLEFISENVEDREVTKVIPKELMTLEISDDPLLRKDLITKISAIVDNTSLDLKSNKVLKDLKSMLEGTYRAPLKFSSTGGQSADQQQAEEGEEDLENIEEEVEAEESEKINEEASPTVDQESQSLAATLHDQSSICEANLEKTTVEDSVINENVTLDQTKQNNSTLIDATEVETTSPASPEKVPKTPKTPVVAREPPTRRSMAKRQIYTPKTYESPLHKRISVIPGTSFSDKTMATPKTPNFTLPNSKISTPNTDRQTRARTRADAVFNSKVTRSQSANATASSGKKGEKSMAKRASKSQTKK